MVKLLPRTIATLIIGLFAILILFPPIASASTIYFSDDFEDGEISDWTSTNGSCGSTWKVENRNESNKLGIVIDGDCFTEIAPVSWDQNIKDYRLSVDMEFVSGADKNLAFRFTDHASWYDIHLILTGEQDSPALVLQHVLNSGIYDNRVTVPNLSNGNTYNVSIEIIGEHIKIFIDNNLVLDYPDAGGRFPTGGIALQASAGLGSSHSEVYFDNVVVSSIDQPVDPVVVIPGMMGSWCKDAIISGGACPGAWSALPEPLDPYDSLIASLQNASDIGSSNVYVWYYDWRKPITTLSSELSDYMDNTVLSGRSAGTKARIVGHSYGGLVGVKYTEDNSGKVSKLVTAGSPHKGVVQSYGAWEGGELWGFSAWEKLALQLLLSSRKTSFPTVKDTIRTEIPSLQNTLPTFDYLVDSSNNMIAESSLNQRNSQLPSQYTDLGTIASFLTTMTGLESETADTLSSVKVKSRDWINQALGLWEDGAPDEFRYSPDGDLSVLRTSGRYDSAAGKPEVAATHVELISETPGINAILSALGSSAAAAITDSPLDDSKNYAMFFLHSPATMSVQFDGQTYADTDGIVVLQDVAPGDADVSVTGTDDGSYHLDVIQTTPTGDTGTTYANTIRTGQTHAFLVHVDPESEDQNPLIDSQGNLYLTFANGKLTEMGNVLASTTQNRSTRLLRSNISQITTMTNRALLQVDAPAQALRTTESALLLLHRWRENLNLLESQRQISSSIAKQLRSLSYDSLEQLQAAYATFASRAGQRYTTSSFTAAQSLITRLQAQIDVRGAIATKGLLPGALARTQSQTDFTTANGATISNPSLARINYLSSRLYLNEAIKVLK